MLNMEFAYIFHMDILKNLTVTDKKLMPYMVGDSCLTHC